MTPEGQKKLEDLLVGITGTTGGAESLRRLELKESKFGHEGFASFCHHHQAEQVSMGLKSMLTVQCSYSSFCIPYVQLGCTVERHN